MDYQQPYGKLPESNSGRVVLDAVATDVFNDIVSYRLGTLGTCAAVYEKNGDCALRILSSAWCRVLDQASRALCLTTEDAEALACGQWHCHEYCWADAARIAIETGRSDDVDC
jgi:hypothetical protein